LSLSLPPIFIGDMLSGSLYRIAGESFSSRLSSFVLILELTWALTPLSYVLFLAEDSNPSSLYLSFFAFSCSSFFLSNKWKPVKYRLSERRSVLIYLSIGLELLSEGLTFTSRSQGLSLESIKISKP
jgi:hypothetical protein